jgi:hypothetical protein
MAREQAHHRNLATQDKVADRDQWIGIKGRVQVSVTVDSKKPTSALCER